MGMVVFPPVLTIIIPGWDGQRRAAKAAAAIELERRGLVETGWTACREDLMEERRRDVIESVVIDAARCRKAVH